MQVKRERKYKLLEKYTFEEFEKILDDGYQVYFTYLKNRYLLFKTNENCYTQKLIAVRTKKSTCKNVNGNQKIYIRNI